MRLANKVAVVTGASSGIGRAAAESFAREGAKVVVADVLTDAGEKTACAIKEAGGEATFVRTDVSQTDDVENLVHQAVEIYDRVDCAFNNAGIEGIQALTHECSEENWDRTIAINLKGVWLCMKYEIDQMLKQGGGTIVNCASIAGLVGFPRIPAYCASKGGVIQLTRTAALEYAQSGIRVNAICPGVIDTPMIDRLTQGDSDAESQLVTAEPIGRMGSPEEVAEAAVWLCSDASSFVTGHPLAVDGGWTAQ